MIESGEDLQRLIDDAIRRHELRVALWSGALGAALLLGTFHAIALLRHELHSLAAITS
jgi:hypothetical protein